MRVAHSLKGVAATLGAEDMAERARRLEDIMRSVETVSSCREAIQAEIGMVDCAFANLVTALSGPATASAQRAPQEPADVRALLDTLQAQLAEGNYMVNELFRQHGDQLRSVLGSRHEEIAFRINQFDFLSAWECLREWRGEQDRP